MNCLDVLTEGMANANIDIAVDQLRGLVKNSPKELGIDKEEYCKKLNQ